MYDYTLSVNYLQSGHINLEDQEMVTKIFIQEIKEAIYGDVRSIVRRLERAYFERDREKLETALKELNNEIY